MSKNKTSNMERAEKTQRGLSSLFSVSSVLKAFAFSRGTELPVRAKRL
jgi:hypothetical protein